MGDLFIEYDAVSTNYTGWNLTEIKNMPVRERRYWIELILWKRDRNG